MTMSLTEALNILRANEAMLRERGVLHAAIFGSVARGEAHPDSDVDVLVDLEPGKPSGMFQYARLQHDIAELFAGKVDVVERPSLRKSLRENILKEAVHAF